MHEGHPTLRPDCLGVSALRANGHGHLYSSDFPYFRLKNPEAYVGILVDDDLRERWTLDIRGDRKSLPRFAEMVDNVELFHYDSDKTYRGRKFALDTLSSSLTDDSVIMFDDIGDNDHFRVMVEAESLHFHVFAVRGKYVGLVGRFCRPFH
ncbi:MAG: class I SAM-dependent methyltransferase [Acidobacteria bacterium]|nr:class I SAM-dependent methyltransferase [Acidobacteriota bacterium]